MAGPGGVESGRAQVRVLPDLSKFGRSLERYLQRQERTLRVEIPTQLDTSELRADLLHVREVASRVVIPLKAQLELDGGLAEIRARLERVIIPLRAQLKLENDAARVRAQAERIVVPVRAQLRLEQDFSEIRARALRVVVQVRARLRLDDDLTAIRARVDQSIISIRAKLALEDGLTEIRARVARTVISIRARLDLEANNFARLRAQLAATVLTVNIRIRMEDILARVRREIEGASARAPSVRVRTEVDRTNSLTLFSSVLSAVQVKVKAIAAGLLGVAANLAGVASVAPMITPLISSALTATIKYGQAALAAAPALLAFAAAGGIVALTLKAITPALGKALTPIGNAFEKMGKQAADAATKGVRPLAAAFAKAALPALSPAITRIGAATNGVVKSFLKFAASTKGLKSLKAITDSTAAAFERIAPAVGRFTRQLVLMLGRIAKVSLNAGSTGLVGFIDKLSASMKKVNAKTVADGLATLGQGVSNVIRFFKGLYASLTAGIAFYKKFETQIKIAQDALAVFAIAFAGPVVAAIAAVGLIIRHWEKIKAAFTSVQASTSGFVAAMVSAFNTIRPAIAGLVAAILPPLQKIGQQAMAVLGPALTSIGNIIKTQVAPAFAAFLTAVTPVVTFLIQKFGVNFIAILKILVGVVKGAFQVIAGVFNVFAGLLTGNWDRLWKGIKQILSGVWTAIKAIVTNGWTIVKNLFSTSGAILKAVTGRIWGGIATAIGNAWKAIKVGASNGWNAVKTGVANAWNSVKSRTSSAWNSVKSTVSSAVSGAVTAVKSKFGEAVTYVGTIPAKIKAALGDVGSLLLSAGADLVRGFISGIRGQVGSAAAAAGDLASKAVSAVKSKLKIFSPSRVMMELGRFVSQGFAEGILGSASQVSSAATKLTQKVQDAVAGYVRSKASLAAKIEADRAAVSKAAKRYRQVVADHARSASSSIRNAGISLSNAQAKYAADVKRNSSSKTLDADRARIRAAKVRYENAIKDQGKSARRAIENARASLKTATDRLAKDTGLSKALNLSSGNLGKLKGQRLTGLLNYIKVHAKELEKLAAVREKIVARLKDAKDKLASAVQVRDDYAKAVADSARAFGSLIAEGAEGRALSATEVVSQLKKKLAAILAFRQSLAQLKAQGLSDAALQQLVDAGVDAGSATAAALAQGGQEAINQVNDLTANISKQADEMGRAAAAQFFQAGVDAAQGLVNGLLAQQAALDAVAKKLADRLVKQVKKSLGIKSPSTVMASLGGFIGQGLAEGIDASRALVERATDRLAKSATPVVADFSSAGGAGPQSGGAGITVNQYYPEPEKMSDSVPRTMRKLAVLGLT